MTASSRTRPLAAQRRERLRELLRAGAIERVCVLARARHAVEVDARAECEDERVPAQLVVADAQRAPLEIDRGRASDVEPDAGAAQHAAEIVVRAALCGRELVQPDAFHEPVRCVDECDLDVTSSAAREAQRAGETAVAGADNDDLFHAR